VRHGVEGTVVVAAVDVASQDVAVEKQMKMWL